MMKFFKVIKSFSTENLISASKTYQGHGGAEKVALDNIRQLWREGHLKEALQKIEDIEREYPSCSKAAKYYRGEIGVELLQQSGVIKPRRS